MPPEPIKTFDVNGPVAEGASPVVVGHQPVHMGREDHREDRQAEREAPQYPRVGPQALHDDKDKEAGQRQHGAVLGQHGQTGDKAQQQPVRAFAADHGAIKVIERRRREWQRDRIVVQCQRIDGVIGEQGCQHHGHDGDPGLHHLARQQPYVNHGHHAAALRGKGGQRLRRSTERPVQRVHQCAWQGWVLVIAPLPALRPDHLLDAVDVHGARDKRRADSPQRQVDQPEQE